MKHSRQENFTKRPMPFINTGSTNSAMSTSYFPTPRNRLTFQGKLKTIDARRHAGTKEVRSRCVQKVSPLIGLDTLYTALEGGLKLLHPFMPFVTEELWQRLPRRPGDETPSIMLASYPVYEKGFDSPSAAAEYEQILGAVKTSRSLLDAYGIKEDAKGITWHYARLIEVKIQVEGKQLTELFNDQLIAIKQLIGTKKLESVSVTNDEAELGWAVSPVNTEINVLLLIKVSLIPLHPLILNLTGSRAA